MLTMRFNPSWPYLFTVVLFFVLPGSPVKCQSLMGLARQDDDFRAMSRDSFHRFTLLPQIKTLFLGKNDDCFIGFGGEIREQAMLFYNESWGSLPPGVTVNNNGKIFLLQRYMLHANIVLTKYARIFAELKSNFEEGRRTGPRPNIDEDKLDLHQLFADINLYRGKDSKLTLRAGRQELVYGASRLISDNEGPNIRLVFQGARLMSVFGTGKADLFYTHPVVNRTGSFDDNTDKNIQLYGIYTNWQLPAKTNSNLDVYAIGYENKKATYWKGIAGEKRYSFGFRWSNNPGRALKYDMEATFQAGTFGSSSIRAGMAVAEINYTIGHSPLKPMVDLVGQIASGDGGRSDQLNTYSALYTRVYFGLGAPYWPSNLVQLTPTFECRPFHALTLDAAIHTLWRASAKDALYLGQVISRTPYIAGSQKIADKKFIGLQYDLTLNYEWTNYFGLSASFTEIPASEYIHSTGVAKDIFFSYLQAKFRF